MQPSTYSLQRHPALFHPVGVFNGQMGNTTFIQYLRHLAVWRTGCTPL